MASISNLRQKNININTQKEEEAGEIYCKKEEEVRGVFLQVFVFKWGTPWTAPKIYFPESCAHSDQLITKNCLRLQPKKVQICHTKNAWVKQLQYSQHLVFEHNSLLHVSTFFSHSLCIFSLLQSIFTAEKAIAQLLAISKAKQQAFPQDS